MVVAGVVIGVTGVVGQGIHREERYRSVTGDTTSSAIRGVRLLIAQPGASPGQACCPISLLAQT
jgi:hypothetical protein